APEFEKCTHVPAPIATGEPVEPRGLQTLSWNFWFLSLISSGSGQRKANVPSAVRVPSVRLCLRPDLARELYFGQSLTVSQLSRHFSYSGGCTWSHHVDLISPSINCGESSFAHCVPDARSE